MRLSHILAVAVLMALVAGLYATMGVVSAAPSVVVSSSDSDDTINTGSTVTLSGYVKEPVADTTYTGHSLQATGGSPLIVTANATSFTGQTIAEADETTGDAPDTKTVLGTVYVAEGTPDGKYDVQVLVASDDDPVKYVAGKITLTVGNAGAGVGSAAITLGYTNGDGDELLAMTATGAKQDTDSAAASTTATGGDTNIVLDLSVNNGIDNPTNNGDVNNITIIAQGGRLNDPESPITDLTGEIPAADEEGSVTYTTANAKTTFTVSRGTPGAVTVWAIVVGTDGSTATSPQLRLKFSGPVAAISLGDVSGSLDDGDTDDSAADPANENGAGVYFDVTGMDSGDTSSAFTAIAEITATVHKAPEGGNTAHLATPAVALGSGLSTTAAPGALRVTIHVADDAGTNIKPGDYTIRVTLGGAAATAKTTTVTVVGDAETVELETDNMMPAFGDIVTVTATVKDKNGNLVANQAAEDGVVFTWAESGLKATALQEATGQAIKKGQATARFVVTSRSGDAIVIANAGGKRATVSLSAAVTEAEIIEVEAAPTAASISLETVGEDHRAGKVVVLASLADADDNPVDGTVDFYHSSDTANLFGPVTVVTSEGTAIAEYNATDDFSVIAISGSLRASLTIEVTSDAEQAAADQAEADRIAAEEAEAQAERDRIAAEEQAEADRIAAEEAAAAAQAMADAIAAEVERLSGTTGFASWLSEHSITASELFSALSESGVTAIHLWNGMAWVRYAVVDGNQVPGSVNFTVNQGDVLFISN